MDILHYLLPLHTISSLVVRKFASVSQSDLLTVNRKLLRLPSTMMKWLDTPSQDDNDKPPDPHNKKYAFETDEWLDPPVYNDNLMKSLKINPSTRAYFIAKYRKTRTPTGWNQYVTLGYLCYEDGHEFDKYWNGTETNWLKRHKMIWYQYKAHVDHNIEISNQLSIWIQECQWSHHVRCFWLVAHYSPLHCVLDSIFVHPPPVHGSPSGTLNSVHHLQT